MNFLELVSRISLGGRTMPKMMVRSGWALALLALLAPGVSMAQSAGESLYDGVVIDSAAGTAYVMSQQGGIDALELATGNVMWNSREAAKPLLIKDGSLLAQARPARDGELVVVAFDASRGTAKSRVGIEIPKFVRANVLNGPSRAFRAEAFEAADGTVVVTWTAEPGRALQGLVEPEPEGMPLKDASASSRGLSGAVRVDMASGRAVPVSGTEALRPRPVTARIAADAGSRQMASIDGRHILHSERNAEGDLWSRYRWTITDAAGVKIGSVEAPVSMAPFVVSGNQLLYVAQPSVRREENKLVEQPLRLRAFDLRSGTELWTSAVVDPAFRGPFPP